ncbi:hypothetical protein [Psychrobacillus sp. L3]|uniref:hypothetical protein n=1 Tax=Psychrobacillus sp. L3 TaxID=3236891 RepID=UPI0036F3B365
MTFSHHIKLEKHANIVTILADKKEYTIDISRYHLINPRKPYLNIDSLEYLIKNGTLIGAVNVYVVREDSVYGGLLGHLTIEYFWDGKMYKAKSITFKQNEPEKIRNTSVRPTEKTN